MAVAEHRHRITDIRDVHLIGIAVQTVVADTLILHIYKWKRGVFHVLCTVRRWLIDQLLKQHYRSDKHKQQYQYMYDCIFYGF